MFRRLNKFIKCNPIARWLQRGFERLEPSAGRGLLGNRAQVAVILIIVIAIALVFYAVTLNLGRITQTKTQVTMASNLGTSILASQMASYGHAKLMSELGGERKVCGWTGFGKILIGIFIVALVVAACLTVVGCGPAVAAAAGTIGTLGAIVLVSLAIGAILLDQLVLQKKIDLLWNKEIALMSQKSAFLEQAIKAALQGAVSDNKRVIDEYDLDMDRIFGSSGGTPLDEISRFAVYYNERLKSIQGPDFTVILNFLRDLNNLVYQDTDNWGMYDPVDCAFGCCFDPSTNPVVPSECNRCCYPLTTTFYTGSGSFTEDLRERCCDPPCFGLGPFCFAGITCGVESTCGMQSGGFPGVSPFSSPYLWVYDRAYDNPTNAFRSFREMIGRDDEHTEYNKDIYNIGLDPIEQIPSAISEFAIEDTTGYFNYDPLFGGSGFGDPGFDPRGGIYPFFYKARDWAVDLTQAPSPPDTTNFPEHCYWWDSGPYATNPCTSVVYTLGSGPEPREVLQAGARLQLPNDPNDPSQIVYNTTERVDDVNVGGVLLVPDLVTVPEDIVSENIDPDYCAQDTLYPAPQPNEGFWKAGADRYCSTTWPYAAQCTKHGTCQEPDGSGGFIDRDCECGEAGAGAASTWPDDALDDIIYGIPEFLEVALELLPPRGGSVTFTQRAQELVKTLDEWYPAIARWIEPGLYSGAVPGTDCFICNQEDGYLWQWLFNLQQMRNRLQNWLDESYAAASCNDVWCAPEASLNCPLVQPDEQAVMGLSTITDVIACLQYNENNGVRFQTCRDECLEAVSNSNPQFPLGTTQDYIDFNNACGDQITSWLPRSLVPGFDPNSVTLADMTNLTPYTDCPTYCYDPGGCMDTCDSLYGDCTGTCDAALQSCCTTCGATAACTGGNPACVTNCNNQWNSCVNTQCDSDQLSCYNDCECVISGTTYECNQPPNALNAALNTDAEVYKGDCVLANFSNNPRWGTCEANGGLTLPAGCPGGGYFDMIEQSIPEAENQAAKFHQRWEFLQARVNEVNHIINNVLDPAIAQLDAFLEGDPNDPCDSPAQQLICERINYTGEELPFEVIYGWQSDPPPRGGPGLWHMVKVEARLPGRCENACDSSQSNPQGWPWIDTYKRGWGTQRCYELKDTAGVVKLRVTRYDENRTSNPLSFPNGLYIWDFRSHPDRSGTYDPANIDTPVRGCEPYGPEYAGAFIVNSDTWDSASRGGAPSDNPTCWSEANQILSNLGVVSETCARYYHHEGAREGFDFRFIPCQPW